MKPEYKIIVAGGRTFTNQMLLGDVIHGLITDELRDRSLSIVSGMAKGADHYAWSYAQCHNIKCYEFPADWNDTSIEGAVIAYHKDGKPYNKAAGTLRNVKMGDFADGLLAFWDGNSCGTKHMINYMRSLEKPVKIIYY